MTKKTRRTRDEWMDERRQQLGMSWDEVSQAASVHKQTLINIRRGGNGHPKTVRNIEAVLGWTLGSVAEIDAGRAPRVLVDPLSQPAAPYAVTQSGNEDDPVIQLRAVRQRMGATAFWREIAIMQSEEATLSSSQQAL